MQSGIGRRRESAIAQEKQNLHAGHRQRLKKRFDAVGLKGFEEHTLLELLLFYAIPQKDTNALAHELIRRFGTGRARQYLEAKDMENKAWRS